MKNRIMKTKKQQWMDKFHQEMTKQLGWDLGKVQEVYTEDVVDDYYVSKMSPKESADYDSKR